jgi:hypothetical protein
MMTQHMNQQQYDWRDDFPLREKFEDYAGKTRSFLITCEEQELGFTVRAVEQARKGIGYEFAAHSETSPYSALGRLREKMRRALATRHITGSPGDYHMLHDRLRGRIAWGDGGVELVVDGQTLGIDNLARILSTHEGWCFELKIVDASD